MATREASTLNSSAPFAALLRQHRLDSDLTQAALAERAGLSTRAIQHLEAGLGQPHPATTRSLADALGIVGSARTRFEVVGRPLPRPRTARTHANRSGVPLHVIAPAAKKTRRMNNLPAQPTSFVGRVPELAALQELMQSTPLLTLAGPGGVGKTRLALQIAARRMAACSDGVWLVELAPLAEPRLVTRAVAAALGVREQPGRDLLLTLADRLRAKQLLLVLDNCEHLVAACAQLADTLLRTCPGVRLLATSREVLAVAGETVWWVPPLSVPDAQQAAPVASVVKAEAVRLFLDRAAAAEPSFILTDRNAPAVSQICRRLEGIPLALELAAARLRALSIEDIARRLDNRFAVLTAGSPPTVLARHQTLRALVDWSYDLLSDTEKRLFGRLSVFAGGSTLEAAEVVCAGDGIASDDVLDVLARLVDKSLVLAERTHHGEVRYRLLETIRQYGLERLMSRGNESEVRQRHAEYFTELAEELGNEDRAWGRGAQSPLDRLERELDNIRAALDWALDGGNSEMAVRLADAMSHLWYLRGYYAEARRWIEGVLALPDGRRKTRTRAALLCGLARCATRQGDNATARALLEESLAIARDAGEPLLTANALFGLAFNATGPGHFAVARANYEEALSLYRELGNRKREASALNSLAWIACQTEDYVAAGVRAAEALTIARDLCSAYLIAQALRMLGYASHGQRDERAAQEFLEQAASVARDVGVQYVLGYTLEGLGLVMEATGRSSEAFALFAQSLQIHQRTGERLGMIRSLEGLASLAAVRTPERGLALASAAATMRAVLGTPVSPREWPNMEAWLGKARQALNERAAAEAWAVGRALSLEETIALALQRADPKAERAQRAARRDNQVTVRELEVLRLIAAGRTNKEIAHELVLSLRTVERHIANVYSKIGARGRADAAMYVVRRHLA